MNVSIAIPHSLLCLLFYVLFLLYNVLGYLWRCFKYIFFIIINNISEGRSSVDLKKKKKKFIWFWIFPKIISAK